MTELTLIQKLTIQSTKEFEVLATNERPPSQVELWLLQRICRKTDLSMYEVSGFVKAEIWEGDKNGR